MNTLYSHHIIRNLLHCLPAAAFFALALPGFGATWDAGDGDWFDDANWIGNAPSGPDGGSNAALFPWMVANPEVTVEIDANAQAQRVSVGPGQAVSLQLGTGVTLGTGFRWEVGNTDTGSGSGNSSMTVLGPASGSAAVSNTEGGLGDGDRQIRLHSGGSLTLSGTLTFTNSGVTTLGFNANSSGSVLTVTDGASLTTGNRLNVGSLTQISHSNSVVVNANSSITAGTIAATNSLISVGAPTTGSGQHSNSLTISGANALVTSGQAGSIGLAIGSDDVSRNLGGNYVEVSDGGTFRALGNINVRGYTEDVIDHGMNRLTIGNGGTVEFAVSQPNRTLILGPDTNSATANGSLLQMAAGGALIHANASNEALVRLHNGSRFEAAGNGLGSNVNILVAEGGTLAVGTAGSTTASVLGISSNVEFEPDGLLADGGVLELTLYGDNTLSSVNFLTGGAFEGTITLSIVNLPTTFGTWTVFTGNTVDGLADATFNLSQVDPVWDTTLFNQAGGWQLQVIPEPSSALLLLAAGGIALALRRRARTRG